MVVDVVVWWTVVSVKVWSSSWFVTVVVDTFSLTRNGVVVVGLSWLTCCYCCWWVVVVVIV